MFFKKKAIASDPLSQAIENFKKQNTEENQRNLFAVLRKYIEEGKWLFSNCEIKDGNTMVSTIQDNGKYYIPIYTEDKKLKCKCGSVVQTDINKYIESLYATTEISGLVFNPGSQNFCLDKEYLIKIILHDKFLRENNAGSPQKNWGNGIPEYNDCDLMTKGQLLNFAMHIVHDYDLKNSELVPISYCDSINAHVNYIMKKDNQIVFIVVYPYAFPNEPVFNPGTKRIVMDLCKKFNAKCMFAPVGLFSCDEERAAAGILLKGDGFYVNYTGMELVEG